MLWVESLSVASVAGCWKFRAWVLGVITGLQGLWLISSMLAARACHLNKTTLGQRLLMFTQVPEKAEARLGLLHSFCSRNRRLRVQDNPNESRGDQNTSLQKESFLSERYISRKGNGTSALTVVTCLCNLLVFVYKGEGLLVEQGALKHERQPLTFLTMQWVVEA